MQPITRWVVVLGLVIASGACGSQTEQVPPDPADRQPPTAAFQKVRGPAVAGAVKPENEEDLAEPTLFYPRHAETLAKMVDGFLAEAEPEPVENVRGLICPHAGYAYSGQVAASGYKLLAGRKIDTVILMGPTHTAIFDGASIPDADAYETPLGLVPISSKAAELAQVRPFVVNPSCEVQRPQFWHYSPGAAVRPADWPPERPAFGEDTPHSWEHSLEVQLPFLQRTLEEFSIVPIVFGHQPDPGKVAVDPEEVAQGLLKYLDEKTLLVASSDLSHYKSYEMAQGLDATCCRAICSLNTDWMEYQEACGKGPILTMMHLARQKGWKARLIDCRNSGDVTGEKASGVVGYAAVAFYQPGKESESETPSWQPRPLRPTPQQQAYLLELARRSLNMAVRQEELLQPDFAEVPEELTEPGGCFVTLTKDGRLRGCIGDVFPRSPLHQAVVYNAAAAALADRRFPPVRPEELDQLQIEISLLSFPTPLAFSSPEELLERLRPGVDGVVLRVGRRQATYLPQVWQQVPDKRLFLGQLAEKAGLERFGWRSPDAQVLLYQAQAFHEQAEK